MRLARILLPALAALTAAGSFDAALAGWPNSPGSNVPLSPSGNYQEPPMVVADGQGGAFFIWSEGVDVVAQHLTAQGLRAPGWPVTGIVVTAAPGPQVLTSVVADGFGGFIAAWEDFRLGPRDVYAQRIAADGTALWTADGVLVCGMPGEQVSPQVSSDGTGGAVLAWVDHRDLGVTGEDIYAQRVSDTGLILWAGGAVAVCDQPGNQNLPVIVSDNSVGGAIIAWSDLRSGLDVDLYVGRVNGDGNLPPGWNPDGNPLCVAQGDQFSLALESDRLSGVFAAWTDQRASIGDLYAVRVPPSGNPGAIGWPAGGIALTSGALSLQTRAALVPDDAGGVIVTWNDYEPGDRNVHAQRLGPGGALLWGASGILVTTAPGNQTFPAAVADGTGGAVIGWHDERAGFPPAIWALRVTGAGTLAPGWSANGHHVSNQWIAGLRACPDAQGGAIFTWQRSSPLPATDFAQRIDGWGYLGAQPAIASVRDVPNDQGGVVKVSWNRSPIDAFPQQAIASYLVFRSVPPNLAQQRLRRGEAVLEAAHAAGDARTALVTTHLGTTIVYWEHVATVPAFQLPGYSHVAATTGDSIAGSNPRTLFMVRAQNADGTRFWLSDPDSGYSVDNLAPAAPAPFTGTYAAGGTHLHWGPNSEADFGFYRLHRGPSPEFVPGPGTLVTSQPDTGFVDGGPAGGWYKLIAVDAHGNESPVAVLGPAGTVGVPLVTSPASLVLAPAFPNPAAGPATCRFRLPRQGAVRLAVHDAGGRLVRELVAGVLPAGEHATEWDGRDGRGARMRGGLYFLRLSFGGRTLSSRLVRVN